MVSMNYKWILVVFLSAVFLYFFFSVNINMNMNENGSDNEPVILPSGEIQLPSNGEITGTEVSLCPPFGFGTREIYQDAANQAGLDASLLSYCNGAWYYNHNYTCVSGTGTAAVCPDTGVICAPELLPDSVVCDTNPNYRSDGSLNCKMKAIAYVLANGLEGSGCTANP